MSGASILPQQGSIWFHRHADNPPCLVRPSAEHICVSQHPFDAVDRYQHPSANTTQSELILRLEDGEGRVHLETRRALRQVQVFVLDVQISFALSSYET